MAALLSATRNGNSPAATEGPAVDPRTLRAACPRALTHRLPVAPADAFAELAAGARDVDFDSYGSGVWLAAFEERIAAELGAEAAVFLPSGTMAQQIALRIACDRRRLATVAFHPLCHLELHEARAYAMLGGLRGITCGPATRPMTVADLAAIPDALGAVLVELPQRELGCVLPDWDDLVAFCDAARARGAHVHLDGARLWEAAPFFGRSHAEIAACFDSTYVSFYKGLGGFAGAALAGDSDFIAEARVWQHRYGGRLVSMLPIALSAALGFERNLGRMAAYRDRAVEVASALATVPGVRVTPHPPQTNHFHVYLDGDAGELQRRADAYARETGTFVFARLAPTMLPGVQRWEFVALDATLALDLDEILRAVRAVVGSQPIPG